MKLKCRPDDFIVTEQISRKPDRGPFALYQLHKTDIGTLEAVRRIREAWNLPADRIQHAGLKDRHARTTQWITIRSGPRAGLSLPGIELIWHGQTGRALSAHDIEANHFDIVVRSLSDDEAGFLVDRARQLQGQGIPNFFDQQRFGSLGVSGAFAAAALCRRDYERATWLALADPNRSDRADEKQQKSILRTHWNDWTTCKERLSRSNRRSVVTYLVDHPDGFRRAFALIRPELRGLLLSAFQSAVWNAMLADCMERTEPASHHQRIGDRLLPLTLLPRGPDDLPTTLPLPSARCTDLPDDIRRLAEAAAADYDLRLDEMKVSHPRDRFFSRGDRACRLQPQELTAAGCADERHPGRHAVKLSFVLPRGCYATMVIKTLTAPLVANGGHE